MPADTYNGMTSTLRKNLAKGASAKTHLLTFTPKPRVLELHSAPEGTDVYSVGRADSSATRFVMKPELQTSPCRSKRALWSLRSRSRSTTSHQNMEDVVFVKTAVRGSYGEH